MNADQIYDNLSDTCSCRYSLETSCNVLDPTCKRNAAQPDEREAWDGDSEESRAAFRAYDSVERARLRSKWQVWRDACAWQAARATAPQATMKGDEPAGFDLSLASIDAYDPQSFINGATWAFARATASQSLKGNEFTGAYAAKRASEIVGKKENALRELLSDLRAQLAANRE